MQTLFFAIVYFFIAISSPFAAKHRAGPDQKKYATFVVDSDTGQILEGENSTLLRHPASMTKMMTLYIIFDAIKRGRITLQTQFRTSKKATLQQPTKLGLHQGELVSVATIIDGLITKSANDAAVVIAEGLEGSEIAFARVMTNTAKRLKMPRTVFKNASGLPDKDQVTTAQDMATLADAIIKHFPNYYKLFQQKSMRFKGHFIRNHNKLLGKVPGVDGIKTGFINMSGHNVTISAKRNGRRIIVVVMGGRTSQERWSIAEKLVEYGFSKISPKAQPDDTRLQHELRHVNYIEQNAETNDEPALPRPRPVIHHSSVESPNPELMNALVRNVVNQHPVIPNTAAPKQESQPRHPDPIRIIIENNSVSVIRPVPREEVFPEKIEHETPSQEWAVKIGQFKTTSEALAAAKAIGGGSFSTVKGFAQGKKIIQAKIGGLSRATAMQMCKSQASKGQPCTPVAQMR